LQEETFFVSVLSFIQVHISIGGPGARARNNSGFGPTTQNSNYQFIKTTFPGQLSLLPSAGREMSTSQRALMLSGWGVKAGMVHSTSPLVDKRVGSR